MRAVVERLWAYQPPARWRRFTGYWSYGIAVFLVVGGVAVAANSSSLRGAAVVMAFVLLVAVPFCLLARWHVNRSRS